MKKIILSLGVVLGGLLTIGSSASALSYWGGNSYYNNSYTYTSGCYIYYYDGYRRTSTLVGSTCGNQNTYNYSYQYQTYPYTYSYPSYTYSYSYPTTSYYTYDYSNGGWYPNNSYYNNYNYGYNNYNTYTYGCYWQNGYQVCY